MENEALYEQAVDLLFPIWRGIDSDFKSKYKLEIWRIFEDRVRVAAGQNGTLARFASQLCRATNAVLGRNDRERDMAQVVIESGADRALLRLYREETPYLVLLLRTRMAALHAEYEEMDDDAKYSA